MNTVIYGAGKYGETTYHIIRGLNGEVKCFFDSYTDDKKTIDGIPVLNMNRIQEMNVNELQVIIAIKDKCSSRDVRFQLMGYGIPNRNIISFNSFIEENDILNQKRKYCLICNRYVDSFFPAGIKGEIFDNNHIIGGGFNPECLCKQCQSIDRYRWFYWVLRKHTDVFYTEKKVLWFAPEKSVFELLRESNPIASIYTADVQSGRARFTVDMTSMQFDDNYFDCIIANHVLEHIEDEQKAIFELMRVVKDDGIIILSFPIASNKKTFENKQIISKEDRLKYYGQEDHVRLYGYDYKERLEKYGLKIKVYSPNFELSKAEIDEYGMIYDDVILICTK